MRAATLSIQVLVAVAAGFGCGLASADDADDADLAAPPIAGAALGSVGASAPISAPRLTRVDTPADAAHSQPGYRNELSEVDYRWWASSGRADLGFGVGTLAYLARPTGAIPGLVGDGSASALAGGTVLVLGLRYRTSDRAAFYADASGLRGARVDGDALAGKVGFEFKGAQSRFNISYGGLGMHLTGDTRMTVRLRRGGFGLFMHRAF